MISTQPHMELRLAVVAKDIRRVKELLAAGIPANLHFPNTFPEMPIHEAARRGFIEGLEALYAAGAKIDFRENHNTTALMVAADNNRIEAGKWLLRHGANARLLDSSGNSALQLAVEHKHFKFAKMMLDEQPRLRDDELMATAKVLIKYSHTVEVAQWLLQEGVSPNLADDRGNSWLFHVQSVGDEQAGPLTEILLGAGAEINLRNERGYSALHEAIAFQSPTHVVRLLRAGADPDLPDVTLGRTPRQIIMNDGSSELISCFQAWEASIKAEQAAMQALSTSKLQPL